MTAFDFSFSFYGIILGLSVAAIAIGAARAFKHRRTVPVGWKTPLLATFAALDIATFWDAAWTNFRHLHFSYGLLVAGLLMAGVYFIAANLIFPEAEEKVESLDDHFWANRRAVLLLLVVANLLMVATAFWANQARDGGANGLMAAYAVTLALYLVLVLPAAFSKRAWVIAGTLGLHILIYVAIAVGSALHPTPERKASPPAAPAVAAAP